MYKLQVKKNFEEWDYSIYHIISMFFDENDVEMIREGNGFIELSLSGSEFIVKIDHNQYSHKILHVNKDKVNRCLFKSLVDFTKKNIPWGTLVGIRPSKIAFKLIEEGLSKDEVIKYYEENYLTSQSKASLCYDIAENEKKLVSKILDKDSYSVYIGMPFCPSRCYYCSFTSNDINKNSGFVQSYIDALLTEIDEIYGYIDGNFTPKTIYFGGGTPTSVDEKQFEKVMKKIYECFVRNKEIYEFTVECGRADTITREKLQIMMDYGATRISINPQTMNDDTLKKIGRTHTSQEVIDAYDLASKMGFKNINMDLIIGLKDEYSEHVQNTCDSIYLLNPQSLTIHGLSVKRSSKLHEDIVLGSESLNNHNEILKMYEISESLAKKLGLKPYYLYRQKNMVGSMENVGYSKEGFESIYNILIMEEVQNILAFGCDGVSKFILNGDEIKRQRNTKDLRGYIKNVHELIEDKKFYIKGESNG